MKLRCRYQPLGRHFFAKKLIQSNFLYTFLSEWCLWMFIRDKPTGLPRSHFSRLLPTESSHAQTSSSADRTLFFVTHVRDIRRRVHRRDPEVGRPRPWTGTENESDGPESSRLGRALSPFHVSPRRCCSCAIATAKVRGWNIHRVACKSDGERK